MAYGCLMEIIPLPIEAVNTHREKPQVSAQGEEETLPLESFPFSRTVDLIEPYRKP